MQIQFVTRKMDGMYEVALMVDGQFKRSGSGKDVLALLTKLTGPILSTIDAEGTEISVTIGTLTAAEAARMDARQARQRQVAEAEAEAAEIEKLTAAVKREKQARAAGLIEAATVQE